MACNCHETDVWEIIARLNHAHTDHRLPLYFRNLAGLAAAKLEQVSAARKAGTPPA